jgi:hypothetical protein
VNQAVHDLKLEGFWPEFDAEGRVKQSAKVASQ